MAAGYVAPLLADAGWQVVMVGRSTEVVSAVQAAGGVTVCVVGAGSHKRWVGGVEAVGRLDPGLPNLVARADLIAISVGPGVLGDQRPHRLEIKTGVLDDGGADPGPHMGTA